MTHYLPTENKQVIQTNDSTTLGGLQMSYGVDLKEPGVIKNSPGLLNVFDEADDADFTHPVYAFASGGSGIPNAARYWATTANYLFRSSADDPSTGWAQDSATNTPTLSARTDMVAFGNTLNTYLFVTGDSTGTIWVNNSEGTLGGGWLNWWVTSKGQSALSTNYYTPIRAGANGYLYIVDSQRKVYSLHQDINGTITTSGAGTLDITYSGHRILTLEPSSSKMWFGTYSVSTGQGGVIEWDMSRNSTEFNRLHELPGPVISICIWGDRPYAITLQGEIYEFNGTNFGTEPVAKFPVPDGFTGFTGATTTKIYTTPNDFSLMHPRGWAIIDGLPHFLVNGQQANATALTGSKQTYTKMPSGIWCLDPKVGLYCRFPLDVDLGAGNSVGSQAVKQTGALLAPNFAKAKFLAGVDFYTNTAGTAKAAILKDDSTRTLATRSRFSFTCNELKPTIWKKIVAAHKKLGANDKLIFKYRLDEKENLPNYADVTWTSTTQFTSTSSTFASAEVGDEVYVILGDGSGCSAHISSMSSNAGTYTVNLTETILGVSNTETSTVRVDNWRQFATVTNRTLDYHDFTVPTTTASRQLDILVELRVGAGSTVRIDQLIID